MEPFKHFVKNNFIVFLAIFSASVAMKYLSGFDADYP